MGSDVWRDHVVVTYEELGRLLGVDPKATVIRMWDEKSADWFHLLAQATEPIEPGQMVSAGGSADIRSFPGLRIEYNPKPSRFFVDVGITQDPTVIYDRVSGQRYITWAGVSEVVDDLMSIIDGIERTEGREVPREVDVDVVGNGMGVYQLLLQRQISAFRSPEPVVYRGREARYPNG